MLNIFCKIFVGDFTNHGGRGGSNAEPGGAGTTYLHVLPDLVDGVIPDDFTENKTLYLNNKGFEPREPQRNLTDFYANYSLASGVAWIWPSPYPPSVEVGEPNTNEDVKINLDYLKVCKTFIILTWFCVA